MPQMPFSIRSPVSTPMYEPVIQGSLSPARIGTRARSQIRTGQHRPTRVTTKRKEPILLLHASLTPVRLNPSYKTMRRAPEQRPPWTSHTQTYSLNTTVLWVS